MDFESIKKFFSLFLTAFGIFIFIAVIYSIFLITHYAKQQQKATDSYANEAISIFPSMKLKK